MKLVCFETMIGIDKLAIFTAKSLLGRSQELRIGLWTASNGMAEVKVSDTKARQRARVEIFPGNIFGAEKMNFLNSK